MVEKLNLSGEIAQKMGWNSLFLPLSFVESAMGYGELDKKIDDFYEK